MSHRDKLTRATLHIADLEARVREYVNSRPYDVQFIEVVGTVDHPPRIVQASCRKLRDLPPDTPLVVGDVLANLRSALDHLAFALAGRFGIAPGLEHRIEFPIFTSEAEFDRRGRRRGSLLSLVPGSVATALRSLQPFDRDDDPLALLHSLNNFDKHRHLVFHGEPVPSTVFGIHPDATNLRFVDGEAPARMELPDGRVLFTATLEAAGKWVEPYAFETTMPLVFPFDEYSPAAGRDALPLLGSFVRQLDESVFPMLEPYLAH